ncbi:MAG: methyltransferase domain-containing protein, partial [Ktedonobacterales bacterium]|nr:methyltransferase domain-containing protein [Ktedonobacterales bacterium]
GITPEQATADQLAMIDHFHTFGKAGTIALAQLAQVTPTTRVLDVGGGIGGPARYLASQVGCDVTVLDLTPAFCEAGAALTEWLHLMERVHFTLGSALAMPFADASFDVVWTQHAAMNIADKAQLYREIFRVVKPGGHFVMFDVLAGPVQPLLFPVPWASDASFSFLLTPDEQRAALAAAGFTEDAWMDGPALVAQLSQDGQSLARGGFGRVGPQLLMGPDADLRMATVGRDLQEGRAMVAMGSFRRPA